jgi:tetraacyldisaccharide 4'-kinase
MKEPGMGSNGRARPLLVPLTPLYRLALSLREWRLRSGLEAVRCLRFPVISIGNLSTGGAGKTPFTIALARALVGAGFAVDVLSRGFGRSTSAPARVRPEGSTAEFGDEPLLIAREAEVPVYVASRRFEAGLLAEASEAGQPRVHLLDDAFQHRQLHRDIDILLLDRDDWRDRLLPAGNLREPRRAAMRASVIAIPAGDVELETALRSYGWGGPVWRLHRRVEVPAVSGPVLAFCGIARPGQFFAGLEAAGMRLARRVAFRDHHDYAARDLNRLGETARAAGAGALVTTAKDQVRLTPLIPSFRLDLPVLTAGLRIEIERESAALDWLTDRLKAIPTRPAL